MIKRFGSLNGENVEFTDQLSERSGLRLAEAFCSQTVNQFVRAASARLRLFPSEHRDCDDSRKVVGHRFLSPDPSAYSFPAVSSHQGLQ
jgi:hypothetical protein